MHLHVTCALLEREGRVFCTRRSAAMFLPHKWEFPGGKINPDELPDECMRREILEELGVEATVGDALPPVTHQYPDFAVTLYPFLCVTNAPENIVLHDHDRAAWVSPEDLEYLDWAAADVGVVKDYLEHRVLLSRSSRNQHGAAPAGDETS